MKEYDLIIFDCDGTLVDSEMMHAKAAVDLLRTYGHEHYTPEAFQKAYTGIGLGATLRVIEEKYGISFPDDIEEIYIEIANKKVYEGVGFAEGAHDVLGTLKGKVKICVGSNGEHSTVLCSLDATGLKTYFPDEYVFTKMQVANPKPAPDLFLYAAAQMGVSPEHTLVIEDTPTGLKAAKAAGMDVLGYTGLAHDIEAHKQMLLESDPTAIIYEFTDILDFIHGDGFDGTRES